MRNSCTSCEPSVGKLARRAGVAVSALHFYETKGLISSQRNASNQRRLSHETLRRVVMIEVAQRVGIPLAEIARALQTLPAGRSPSAADWTRLSAQWKRDLAECVDKPLLLRDQPDGCIDYGCLSLQVCPLHNLGDQLSAEGPEAHWLGAEGREHDGQAVVNRGTGSR